jgi:hypothetical protein
LFRNGPWKLYRCLINEAKNTPGAQKLGGDWQMRPLIELETGWTLPPADSNELIGIHRYWAEIKGRKARPSRQDIRPKELSPYLPYVFLVDAAGDDFRFRLAGSHFTQATGQPMAGSPIAQIFPDLFCEEVRDAWGQCARYSTTVFGRGKMWLPEKDYLQWEGMVMPLADGDGEANMLFGAIKFRPNY